MKKKVSVNSNILESLKNNVPFNPKPIQNEKEIIGDDKTETKGEKIEEAASEKKKRKNIIKDGGTTKTGKDNYIFDQAGVPFESFDKTTKKLSYISEKNHQKLTMLANETGSNIMDMGDSIISDFFEQNKGLIKKIMQKKISNIWE